MNLLLMKAGYPPLVIGVEDRVEYLESPEQQQLREDAPLEDSEYYLFMLARLNASLDDYLRFLTPTDE